MTVRMMDTGKTVRVNDSYGMRLTEQKKAVIAEKAKPKRRAAKKNGAV